MIVSVVLPAMNSSLGTPGAPGQLPISLRTMSPRVRKPTSWPSRTVLVAHERCDFGDGLLGRDAHHLARHDVAHAARRRARRHHRAHVRAGEDLRREQVANDVPLAHHAEHAPFLVDDGERAKTRAHHRAGRLLERRIGEDGARLVGHDVAHGELLGKSIHVERIEPDELSRAGRGVDRVEHLALPQQAREAADDLQIACGLPRRRDDEQHDARALLVLARHAPAERRRCHAHRDEELAGAVRPVVHQKGAVAHAHDVLRPRFARAPAELLRVEHLARREDALEQLDTGLLERARRERDDDPFRCEEFAQLHATDTPDVTCGLSAARRSRSAASPRPCRPP
jgi:hypothetical protein